MEIITPSGPLDENAFAPRPSMAFCTSRPSHYAEVLVALRKSFDIVLTDNGSSAQEAIDYGPDVLVIEEKLTGADGLNLLWRARQVERETPMLIILAGPRRSAEIDRLVEEGIADRSIVGRLSPGEFLSSFWQAFGQNTEDRAVRDISQPAAAVLDTGRALFGRLDTIVAQGGVTADDRRAIAAAAESVVTLADDPSVSAMLEQLRGHHDNTFAHSLRVGILMASFGRAISLPEDQLRLMAETGLLHDLGKSMVPLTVLAKPGRLTTEEWAEMNKHPVYGAQLVSEGYSDLPDLIAAVKHHHEKLDGSGYPDGQAKGTIHEMAVCTAVVDVFSALTDRRDYKEGMSREQAFAIMDGMVGHHLEPRLYRRFRELVMDAGLADAAMSVS